MACQTLDKANTVSAVPGRQPNQEAEQGPYGCLPAVSGRCAVFGLGGPSLCRLVQCIAEEEESLVGCCLCKQSGLNLGAGGNPGNSPGHCMAIFLKIAQLV